jgi:FlaG/FlaF family flagellin (archaellin)
VANSFQDISQVLTELLPTFPPQSFTSTAAGQSVNVADVGTDRINAQLIVGDANTFTSLAVKMQAAYDDGAGSPTGWADIDGATFTTVTTDPGTGGAVPQTIQFQLPTALSLSTAPYIYVRAYATLVGTSILMCVNLLACRRYDQENIYVAAPGNDGNNVIN